MTCPTTAKTLKEIATTQRKMKLLLWKPRSPSASVSFSFSIFFMEFDNLILLCWNVRGAFNLVGRRHARDLVRMHRPLIIILMETHCPFSRVSQFWNRLGYEPSAISEANGHAGGIWILKNRGCDYNFTVIDIYFQAVTISISKGETTWLCSAVYASPQAVNRDHLWSYLLNIRPDITDPWLLIGDFNEVLLPSEIKGGPFYASQADKFANMIENCNLLDLGATGSKYTWARKEGGIIKLEKRLDRALGDIEWRNLFPEAYVENLTRKYSDHRPMLLRGTGFIPPKQSRPFRFQAAWLTHKDFPEVVHKAWLKGEHVFPSCLSHVRHDASQFNRDVFGDITRRKQRLGNKLKNIQSQLERVDSARLCLIESALQKEYNDILRQEEILWYQKSRENWVKLGDRNTKFFHTQTVVRRKRNKIQGLVLADGHWSTDNNLLQTEAVNYFQDLFRVDPSTAPDTLNVPLVPCMSDICKNFLTATVLKEEVRQAVFSMKSYKAPGPDGFQPIFFKHFWDTIGDDLWHLVQQAFSTGSISESLAETLLVLIPKESNPRHLKSFRPISLCNVSFKVVTKVLVNRLRPFLDELISPLQSSFIPGRGTTDNAILAQEVVHYMHKSRSKKGSIAFKIDLEKAYDRINWQFLELTLQDFGFPSNTVSLIMNCVQASNLAVLWNGAQTNYFKPSRGLRQGDPLSPYLFVLCMEKLSLSIQHRVNSGDWIPVQVSKNGPSLSHILFADDIILFCEASVEQVQVVMDTLDDFCQASGLKVNVVKSKAMCSKMVQGDRRRNLKQASSIKFVADLGHYLGFPLVQGRVNRGVYNGMLDKVQQKLASWKGNLLNKAGRVCLVKAVTTSIPTYTMQLHYLPSYVCNRLDRMSRSFIWGGDGLSRTWNHVNWKTVTTPCRYGGLGIREARLINISLLGKLLWSIIHDRDKLWVQVLSHKYLKHGSIWVAKMRNNPSITWKGILKAITDLSGGYSFRVGEGNTSFWYSDWSKLGPLCSHVPYVHISDTALCLRDVARNGSWDLQNLYTQLPQDLSLQIQNCSVPSHFDPRIPDAWTWKNNKHGKYTCSSGYFWLLERNRNWDHTCNASWIWKLKAPAKVQHFIWLCYNNALSINARRHICNMAASPSCTRCSSPMEDLLHCLRDCPHSKELWIRLGLSSHANFFTESDARTWLIYMARDSSSILFLAGLWQAWCWRNNMIFEDHPWLIHEVVRKAKSAHDEYITFYPHSDLDPACSRLLARWIPPVEGYVKLNTDGSFLEDRAHAGSGGIIRDHNGDWVAGFTHFATGGDADLAEIQAVNLGLSLCHDLGFKKVICESDCLEAVNIINDIGSYPLHSCASLLLDIVESMRDFEDINLVHVLREQNKCADFLAKEGAHSTISTHWESPPPGLDSLILLDKLSC